MDYSSDKTKNLSLYMNRISGIASLLIIFTVILATFVIAPPVSASDLDDFETAATTDNSNAGSDEEKEEECKCFFRVFFRILIEGVFDSLFSNLADQAKMSFARIDGSTGTASTGIEIRETGEPTLPFFQMDCKYLYINPEITALDERCELGYAAFGFEYRNTCFAEINPSDNLTLTQYRLLLRIS